jgi:uncharacterized protein with GYD domain
MTSRRFPAPWQVEQTPGGYKVLDANGQALAYVYAREIIGGKRGAVRTLTLKAFSEDEYHKIVRSLD